MEATDKTAAVDTPRKAIPEAIRTLASTTHSLSDVIGSLEKELQTVLAPEGPATASKPEAISEPTRLAEILNDHIGGLDSLRARVRSMCDRLEV